MVHPKKVFLEKKVMLAPDLGAVADLEINFEDFESNIFQSAKYYLIHRKSLE